MRIRECNRINMIMYVLCMYENITMKLTTLYNWHTLKISHLIAIGSHLKFFFLISILFSITAVVINVPSNSIQEFPFLYHLINTLSILTIVSLTGMKWYPIVVFICICLIGTVKHFFIYLLVICMSSFEKYLSRSTAHFKNQVAIITICYWIFWILTYSQILSTHHIKCSLYTCEEVYIL
jgi:hypothetical protein